MLRKSKNGMDVPLCEADIKRIEREVERHADDDSVANSPEGWAEQAIRSRLSKQDRKSRHLAKVRVDLPPEVGDRARLIAESEKQRKGEVEDESEVLTDILLGLTEMSPEWYIDGQKIHEADEDGE